MGDYSILLFPKNLLCCYCVFFKQLKTLYAYYTLDILKNYIQIDINATTVKMIP